MKITKSKNNKIDLTEALSSNIVPKEADIVPIIESYILFEKNKNIPGWTQKNGRYCPWNIAWMVSPAGKRPSDVDAVKIYLIALLINWKDLVTQLNRTVKMSHRISKKAFEDAYTLHIKPNLVDICRELTNAAATADKEIKAGNVKTR